MEQQERLTGEVREHSDSQSEQIVQLQAAINAIVSAARYGKSMTISVLYSITPFVTSSRFLTRPELCFS